MRRQRDQIWIAVVDAALFAPDVWIEAIRQPGLKIISPLTLHRTVAAIATTFASRFTAGIDVEIVIPKRVAAIGLADEPAAESG